MKQIDMSVLPDGFLIELLDYYSDDTQILLMDADRRGYKNCIRPLLNHWHFNDGSLTLPDGLACEFIFRNGMEVKGWTDNDKTGSYFIVFPDQLPNGDIDLNTHPLQPVKELSRDYDIIAVKILGVTAEYGAQLGMEVIEL